MTDREALEAAAEAIHGTESTLFWDELGEDEREWYRKMAGAALKAAGLVLLSEGGRCTSIERARNLAKAGAGAGGVAVPMFERLAYLLSVGHDEAWWHKRVESD